MARVQEPSQVIGGKTREGVLQSTTQGRALAENRLTSAVQASAGRKFEQVESFKGGGADQEKIAAMQIEAQDRRAAEAVTAREEDREYQTGREDKQRLFISEQANLVRNYNDAKDAKDETLLKKWHEDWKGLEEARLMMTNKYKQEDRAMLAKRVESQIANEAEKRKIFHATAEQRDRKTQESKLRANRRKAIATKIEGRENLLAGTVEGVTKEFNELASSLQLGGLTLDNFSPEALPQLITDISRGKIKEYQLVGVSDIIAELRIAGVEAVKTKKATLTAFQKESKAAGHPIRTNVEVLAAARLGNRKLLEAEMTLSRLLESDVPVTDATGKPTSATVGKFAARFFDIKNETEPTTYNAALAQLAELETPEDLWKSYLAPIRNPGQFGEDEIARASLGAQKYLQQFNAGRQPVSIATPTQ